MPFRSRLLAVLHVAIFAVTAHAAQDQMYGLGGISTGRTGSLAAEPENSFSSLLNPALLAAAPARLFSFSLGTANAHFDAPKGVVLDGRKYRTRDGQDRVGTASIPDIRTAIMAAGYAHPIALDFWPDHKMGIGLSLSGPLGQFRRWVALSPYDFTLLRYGGADTQFKGTLGLGLELIPGRLYFGGGVSLFMTSNGITEAALNSENQTGRMAMDIAFNTSGIVGLYSKFGRISTGLVYRQAVNPVLRQTFEGTVQMGGPDVANQPAAVEGSLYYEPGVFELEMQYNADRWVASAGLGYQVWRDYQPRYLIVSTRDASGASRSTLPAPVEMQSTWNPRASLEWRGWHRWRLAAGYQYRPTAVSDLSDKANLLDSDTHVAGLNIRRDLGKVLFFEDFSLGLFGQVHFLRDRTIQKSAGDLIGAPGYTFGGRTWVLGLAMTSNL